MGQAPFVGRSTELEALSRLARHAASGRATTAVLSGPAGVGKSALLSESLAGFADFRVVRLFGDETEQDLPYAALSDLLDTGTSEWASPFTAGADALRALGEWCERGPVVCAVDDAHLCDAPSLAAMSFMMRRMRSDPLLLVLTVRPENSSRLPTALARASQEAGHWTSLSGLSVQAVRDLSEALGLPRLSWHAASRVRERTDGNPLHLRTLLEEVPVQVLEDLARPIPAPASLAPLVVAELRKLSPVAQQVAAAGSVLGDRPAIDALVALADVDRAAVRDACEELGRARILHVAAGSAHCQFTHPLLRSAIYGDLGPSSRATLHTRAASLSSGREALEHRVQAAFGLDATLAADLEADAQENAASGRLFRAARALLQAARLSPPGVDAHRRLLLGVEALLMDGDVGAAQAQVAAVQRLPRTGRRLAVEARLAWMSGQPAEAIRLGQEAWAHGEEDLAPEELDALAALMAQIELLGDNLDEAPRWAARALRDGRLDPAATPHIRAVQCTAVALRGRVQEALRLLEGLDPDPTAVPLRQHPELATRGILRMLRGDLDAAEADLAVGGSLERSDLAAFRLTASAAHAECLFRRGDWDLAQQTVEHTLGLSDDMGQVWVTGYIHSVAALVPSARGDWERAEAHVAVARTIADQLGDRATTAYALDAAVHLSAQRGDPEAVVTAAEQLRLLPVSAPAHQPGVLHWPVHLTHALVELGRTDEAAAVLDLHERLARDQDHRPFLVSAAWLAGVLAAAKRDSGRARAAFDRALALCDDRTPRLDQALARYHYGRFLRRRGERRRAALLLQEARERASGLGAAPLLARCDEELAACGVVATEPTRPTAPAAPALTPQEQVVAALVCAGHSNRDIAAKLVLSPKTVGYHLSNVYAKLDVHSRVQLAQALNEPSPTRR